MILTSVMGEYVVLRKLTVSSCFVALSGYPRHLHTTHLHTNHNHRSLCIRYALYGMDFEDQINMCVHL